MSDPAARIAKLEEDLLATGELLEELAVSLGWCVSTMLVAEDAIKRDPELANSNQRHSDLLSFQASLANAKKALDSKVRFSRGAPPAKCGSEVARLLRVEHAAANMGRVWGLLAVEKGDPFGAFRDLRDALEGNCADHLDMADYECLRCGRRS